MHGGEKWAVIARQKSNLSIFIRRWHFDVCAIYKSCTGNKASKCFLCEPLFRIHTCKYTHMYTHTGQHWRRTQQWLANDLNIIGTTAVPKLAWMKADWNTNKYAFERDLDPGTGGTREVPLGMHCMCMWVFVYAWALPKDDQLTLPVERGRGMQGGPKGGAPNRATGPQHRIGPEDKGTGMGKNR